jgi:hypothetical protein
MQKLSNDCNPHNYGGPIAAQLLVNILLKGLRAIDIVCVYRVPSEDAHDPW